MADIQTGMEKAEMKKLLVLSKKEPVNCAVGQGREPGVALLMMDKIKAPKAVEKELVKKFPDAKALLFGTVVVDADIDPTLVQFRLNKAMSGVSRKLMKTLKGTGFKKVQVMLDDGTLVESGSEEEEAPAGAPAQPSAGADAPAAPQPAAPQPAAPQPAAAQGGVAQPSPPQPSPQQPGPPQPDAGAMTARLTGLVRRMMPVLAADPSRLDTLKGLAGQAQAALKSGDIDAAGQHADALEKALAGPAASPAAAPAAPAAPQAAAAPPSGQASPAVLAKSRLAWVATRKKIESDIGKLKGEIMAACQGQDIEAALEAGFRDKVEPVLHHLDDSLSDKLDELNNATDGAQRTKLVSEAKQIMQRYQAFVSSEPIIKHLDENPFVPLQISRTLTATLSTLASSVR